MGAELGSRGAPVTSTPLGSKEMYKGNTFGTAVFGGPVPSGGVPTPCRDRDITATS